MVKTKCGSSDLHYPNVQWSEYTYQQGVIICGFWMNKPRQRYLELYGGFASRKEDNMLQQAAVS